MNKLVKRQPFFTELDPQRVRARDEGLNNFVAVTAICAAAILGAVTVAKLTPPEAPVNTAPGSGGTVAPGDEAAPTNPGGSSPNTVVTTGGMIDATVPPTAPTTPTTPAPAAPEVLAHTYNYSVKNSDGVVSSRQLNCANGAPIMDLTMLPHRKSGEFSLFYTIDQYFASQGQETNMLNGNVSMALAIVGDSDVINPNLNWDAAMATPGFNIDNLHAPGDPTQPGHVAVATGCLDAKNVTWIPALAA